LYNYLIKILLLLSASLSIHSALAMPLSSLLASNHHVVRYSDKLAKPFNTISTLSDFSSQQLSQSKLPTSLVLLLQEKNDVSLLLQHFLDDVIKIDIKQNQVAAQSEVRQSYQAQLSSHLQILARQNSLYSQKNSYQAKLQQQQTS